MSPTRLILLALAVPLGAQDLVLADFPAGVTQTSGWTWEFFSDRVMGGRSDLEQPVISGSGSDRALRLAGAVNTKGGGFIQVRLRRTPGILDAAEWKGIEATLEAAPGGAYFVHARTADTRMPWSYYVAPLAWPGGRVTLRIPWSAFEGVSVGRVTIRPELIQSVALVAADRDFAADLRIYRLSFYR